MHSVSFRQLKRCSGKVSAKVSCMFATIFRSHISSLAASTRLGAGVFCLALAFSARAQEPAAQPAQPDTPQQAATPEAPSDESKKPDVTPEQAPAATQQQTQTAQPPDTPQQAATPEAQSDESKRPAATPVEAPAASTAPAPEAPVAAPPAAAPAMSEARQAAKSSKAKEGSESSGISEDELKQMLMGKALYLRDGYLDNTLKFDERGRLDGHSPQGSYTLCAIEINKIRLTKHKLELVGIRYGLHFPAQLAYEASSTAFDRVRITPKKKVVIITVDREIVVKPKKVKEARSGKGKKSKQAEGEVTATDPAEPSAEDQLKASIAATPEADRPADAGSVTTTTSPAHAKKLLKDALDKIFAQGLDERLIASMPDFWKLYYEAVAAKSDYRPKDPSILRQNTVDQKAMLLTKFEPESNEFAQANGVAGMALYHTVVDADGKAAEISVARPIGFGLDENAVAAIRKASFQPAVKDGKPVPVLLDLVVQFRIFDNRTAAPSAPEAADKPAETALPGPYSLQHP
jgi:TonB family protein